MNMEDFGVPQRRRRCIAGNFDYDLLAKYGPGHAPTLGSVIKALSADPVVDPIYGITIPRHELFDHDVEGPLNEEEVRINRASKTLHPVYNSMPFPDPLDRSEEHTSELQSLMRISYAVFCLKKKTQQYR